MGIFVYLGRRCDGGEVGILAQDTEGFISASRSEYTI